MMMTWSGPSSATLTDKRQLHTLGEQWQELHSATPDQNPFLSWEWISAWLETHPHDGRPWVAIERFDDGSLAGIAPFQLHRRGPLSQLEFLAQRSGGDELDLLIHPRADDDLPARLLDHYFHRPGWNLWSVEYARSDGHAVRTLNYLSRSHRTLGWFGRGTYLPYLQLPRTFDEFLASRSPNFRSEVRRRRRALERAVGRVNIAISESVDDLEDAIKVLFRLHNLRRAQKQDRGIFEDASVRAFHNKVAVAFARKRAARMYQLVAADRPIAALYGFEARQTFYFFQSGFDPQWTAHSPGTVMMSAVVEDCIRRGLRVFDFLRGAEFYKSRWASSGRYDTQLRIGRGTTGLAYFRARELFHQTRARLSRDSAAAQSA